MFSLIRYPGPNDVSVNDARSRLSKYQHSPAQQKVEAYLDLCKKVTPVFRHFFTENFAAPLSWFSARLTYTRSVATTSMVGHMMGLGDRHVSNILVDTANGELVHIDFGIAFDQVSHDNKEH